MRCAGDGPLYLERYLPSPVEQLLRSGDRSPVARSEIVEIGNLASSGRGGSLFLFVMLTAFLHRSRITHAAVTATQSLRRTFAAFGFEFSQLARACPQRLPDGGSSWGSYFRTDPWVLAGPIAPASARLGAYLPDEHNGDLEDLTARLHSCEQDPLS